MEFALGVMASLAPKLGDLLMAEYVVQKGLKPDIESLSRELVIMNAALKDVSRVLPEQLSDVEKLWARMVRELSYDMEDVVDNFVLRVAGGGISATSTDANVLKKILGKATAVIKKAKDRRQISSKVIDLKKLSNELAELHAKYTVRGAGANFAACTGIDPRVLNLYKKESDLVGIEESRDKVIRMLCIRTKDDVAHADASEQSRKIVSIVGVGGLGKTTLAKTVHDTLKAQFGCSAFVSVGRTPNMTRVIEKMLVELDKNYKQVDMARWDLERFVNELHEFLQHKRYFIVVDDIWDVGSWEVIRYALKDNNCGSRIIMTTRNFEIVTKVEKVYRLKPLSEGNSRKLFYKRIQSQEGESLDDVSCELSSKIIDKCGGVPLAIIAIASLLVERPCEDWSKVYDLIGFGNGDNTTKILSYSYYDLPAYLKPVLLHLSIFPEDFIFDTKGTIWMWVAEGFVHLEKEDGSLLEVGERYFKELVNRSMIQPTKDKDGRFSESFRIHDIVLDLILELLKDEDFITILDRREQHSSLDSLSEKRTGMTRLESKVRWLAVRNHHVRHFPEDIMDMLKALRSLSFIYCNTEIMVPLHSFKVCRVLCIESSRLPINLKHLVRLLHLKYIKISDTPVDVLPEEIGHLKSLQTLILINTGLDELTPAVCLLTQLMCLDAIGFERFPADRMGNLTSLEHLRLEWVVGRNATEDLVVALGKLTRLRVVTITFSEELDESLQQGLVQSLRNLRELKELELLHKGKYQDGATVWEDWEPPRQLLRLVIQGIIFLRLPRWINRSRLPCLFFLFLGVYVVEVEDLDNLARLPKLSHLDLLGISCPQGYTVGTDSFKNLIRLCIPGTVFKFHMGAMPMLEYLHCGLYAGYWNGKENNDGLPSLERFPTKDAIEDLDLGLDNLLSLEQVDVELDCSGATRAEVEEVVAVVTRAVENHPNHPAIKWRQVYERYMLSDERKEALLQQNIKVHCPAYRLKDEPDASFILELRSYRLLQKAVISIDCEGASMCEVEKVEAAFRHAAEAHRNHPIIELIRTNANKMAYTDTEQLVLKNVFGRNATEQLVLKSKLMKLRLVDIIFSEKLDESLQQDLVRSLCNLRELQKLDLISWEGLSQKGATVWEDWEPPRQLLRLKIVGINFSRLPRWINRFHLPSLFLSVDVYVVEVEDLDSLARLPELSHLELGGFIWPPGYTVGTGSFKTLRFCDVGTTLKFHMGAMPRLEHLQFEVYAGYWSWEDKENDVPLEQFPTKDVFEDLDLGLDNLLSLEQVDVQVDCSGATAAEVQEVEAAVTRAVGNHPNHPTIQMDRVNEGNILSDERSVALLQQNTELHYSALQWKDKPDASFIAELRLYRLLQKAVITIDCAGASMCEVEKVEAAFRRAAEVHRNHPIIKLIRTDTDKMVSSSDHPDTEQGDDHNDSPDNSLSKLQLRN